MSAATPQQVRQWSEEVAADPASLSFLPLAQAYRAMEKRDAALRLVLRGLERHPTNVEAHFLLGLLYRESGETLKAFDEFGMVLALSPEHREARRESGLTAAALGEWDAAVRHLERAYAEDPADNAVANALTRAREKVAHRPSPAATVAASGRVASGPAATAGSASASTSAAGTAASGNGAGDAAAVAPVVPGAGTDVGREFDTLQAEMHALSGERGMVGAVVLDAQGFVVAGGMTVGGADRAAELAAVLSGASTEAERTVRHLKMGEWRGILVETPDAVLRLAPTGDGGMVAVAGRRDVPTGWVLRLAARAQAAALRFLAAVGGGEGR
jgi:predicted regulator of Ras-like GTPase activity (Roadblock/LC7/MglB family)